MCVGVSKQPKFVINIKRIKTSSDGSMEIKFTWNVRLASSSWNYVLRLMSNSILLDRSDET